MIVQLKCFDNLASPHKCDFAKSTAYELAEGQTVENLISCINKLASVNCGDW